MQIQDNSIVSKRQIYLLCRLFTTAPWPKTTGCLSWCPQVPTSYLRELWQSLLGPGRYLRNSFITLGLMHGSRFKDIIIIALVKLFSVYKKTAFSFLSKRSRSDAFILRTSCPSTSFATIPASLCGSLSLPRYRSRFGGGL